jgi:hypothetical protein
MTNIAKMMKKAQEMQEKMGSMQAEMENIEVEGQSGAGMVKLTLDGKGNLKKVSIDPEIFNSEDAEVVEDLIIAAHTDAKAKSDAKMQEEMTKLTGGLGLPPGLKLPF